MPSARFLRRRTRGIRRCFVLREDEETLAEYPFRFELRIRYTLEGNTLHADVCVFNPDEEPLYCNFGSHEAYAAEHFSEWERPL